MPSRPGGSETEDEELPLSTGTGHTQFLDLTNGKGGERPPEDDAVEEIDEDEEGDVEDDGGHTDVSAVARGPNTSNTATFVESTTPGGTITKAMVDTGSEHTGRWTKEEHEAFLAALHKYGKEWKKVAAKVKTRSVVQTRTHAQKYFQKLQKSIELKGGVGGGGDVANVEMGATTEPKKIAAYQSQTTGRAKRGKGGTRPHRRGSAATMSAAQVISTLSNAKTTTSFVATSSSNNMMIGGTPSRAHGFSVDSGAEGFPSPYGVGSGWRPGGTMKIIAPDPSQARSKFPEPSPAATGKRKLAEIAAARMLAGVGSSDGPPTPPPQPSGGGLNLKDAPPPPLFRGNKGLSLQIVNPESLGVNFAKKKRGDSPVTPWDGELEALVVSAAEKAAMDEDDDKLSGDSAPTTTKPAAAATNKMHPINGPADAYERSPLHQAVCSQDIPALRTLLDVLAIKPDAAALHILPDVVEPVGLQEDVVKPDELQEGIVKPDEVLGDVDKPEDAKGNVVKPDDLQGDAVKPDDLQGYVLKPDEMQGDVVKLDDMQGDVVKLDDMQEGIVKPDEVLGDVDKPEDSKGNVVKPDDLQGDAVKPDDLQGYVLKPDDMQGDVVKLDDMQGDVVKPDTASEGHAVKPDAAIEGDAVKPDAELQGDAVKPDAALQNVLYVVKPEDLQRLDEAGYGPLHSACAMLLKQRENSSMEGVPNEMVRMLLTAGADPALQDSKGNSPLHWAVRAGDRDAADQIIQKSGSGQNAKNFSGETPLHWAMRSGMRGAAVVNLLLASGARAGILDKSFRRPIDVAVEGFADDEDSLAAMKLRGDNQGKKLSQEIKKMLKLTARERMDVRANLLIRSAHSRTLVLHHPECLEHHTKSQADWEAPDRVKTIMRRILPYSDPTGATETSGIFPHEVSVSQEFDRANLDLLSRVHSTEYLSFVNNLSKDLERKVKESAGSMYETDHGTWSPPPVVPFTPMVQRSMIKIDESSIKLSDNSDTSFSAGSLRAARRAAGAVQHAVDCVLLGRNRNAFCVVRPPGHHAGVNGLLEGGESCGFCIFNNVAAGAMHAISDDKLLCERCAIVDIDVHHGNGTEEIVRKCHDPSKLFFFSIHLYDNDKDEKKRSANQFAYKFYPGTGSKDDLAMNIINVPIMPLWKDTSPSAAPKTHNTRNKTRGTQEPNDDSSEPSTPRISSKASDAASDTGSCANVPHPKLSSAVMPGRTAYRQAIQNRLLPALRAFNPDLILISAGFDAAKGDVGNARHEKDRERMGLDLEPEDYSWTTRKILEIADICCQGRVVSVLEGGYGRTPPSPAVDGMPQSLDRSVFGECAVRHLHAMIDPYDAENRFAP